MKKYTKEGSDEIRMSIANALFSLLKDNALEDIGVGEICNNASVGRTTYYRYFGSKSGKNEALLFWFTYHWDELCKDGVFSAKDKDIMFLNYLYENKVKLLLLKSNNSIEIIDSFILYVYGPKENDEDFYFKYAGAGLWIGLVRAVMKNDFNDDIEIVQKKIAESMMKLVLSASK